MKDRSHATDSDQLQRELPPLSVLLGPSGSEPKTGKRRRKKHRAANGCPVPRTDLDYRCRVLKLFVNILLSPVATVNSCAG
jgi:hypothetical protein